jgi:hypothetical protein
MPKRLARPTVTRHYQLFEDDIEFLTEHYGPRSVRGLSVNEIVRNIVADAVKAAKERMHDRAERERLIARAQEPR